MNQLHLKYKMDNGIPAYQTINTDDGPMELPSEEYLEWLEDLALKQLKRDLSSFTKEELLTELSERNLEYLRDPSNCSKLQFIIPANHHGTL